MIDLRYYLGNVEVTYRNEYKTTGLLKLNATENDPGQVVYPFIFTPSDKHFVPLSYTEEGHCVKGKYTEWDIVEVANTRRVKEQQEPSPSLQSVALVLVPYVVKSLSEDQEFQALLSQQVEKTLNTLSPNTFQDGAAKAIADIVQSKIALAID